MLDVATTNTAYAVNNYPRKSFMPKTLLGSRDTIQNSTIYNLSSPTVTQTATTTTYTCP